MSSPFMGLARGQLNDASKIGPSVTGPRLGPPGVWADLEGVTVGRVDVAPHLEVRLGGAHVAIASAVVREHGRVHAVALPPTLRVAALRLHRLGAAGVVLPQLDQGPPDA